MTDVNCMEIPKIKLLKKLFASATQEASTAMCRWTNSLVSLTLDDVREVPLEGAYEALQCGDALLTMVVLTLEGEVGGTMVLVFDNENGRRLAASLLQCGPPEGDGWTELEQSALTETGNILGCAYVNALTRLIDHPLVPSTPYFVQDYGASVLQQAVLAQAATTDTLLICHTGFYHEDEKLSWRLLFIPSFALRRAMENALHNAF